MAVRLCPSLRAPPAGERACVLTTPQREHHAHGRPGHGDGSTCARAGLPARGAPAGAGAPQDGAVAQMGERCARTAEAAGSNPASSTCHRDVAQPGRRRLLWEQETAGSNPAIPTMPHPEARRRGRRLVEVRILPGTPRCSSAPCGCSSAGQSATSPWWRPPVRFWSTAPSRSSPTGRGAAFSARRIRVRIPGAALSTIRAWIVKPPGSGPRLEPGRGGQPPGERDLRDPPWRRSSARSRAPGSYPGGRWFESTRRYQYFGCTDAPLE